jgi:starch synthase
VKDITENNGNGFMFQDYTVLDMLEALKRAEASFYRRAEWHNLIRRNMKLDFSWKDPASKYEGIYLRAVTASGAQ